MRAAAQCPSYWQPERWSSAGSGTTALPRLLLLLAQALAARCCLDGGSIAHECLTSERTARRLNALLGDGALRPGDYPIEARVYKRGGEMEWHRDDVLYAEPQVELVLTLENDSDSQTQWVDAAGKPFQLADPVRPPACRRRFSLGCAFTPMAPAVVQAYMDRMVSPAYPGTIDGYGLLTWLNTGELFARIRATLPCR